MELDLAFEHRRQRDVGKVLHTQEPLLAEARLHRGVRIALGIPDLVVVILHLFQQAGGLQVLHDPLADHHPVKPHIEACSLGNRAVRVEDVDGFQVVRLAQRVVVHVVSGRHLQAARTELDIHIAVFDHAHRAAYERYRNLVAAEPAVLGVLGVDTHRGITHDGLRAGGSHHGIVTAGFVAADDLPFRAGGLHGVLRLVGQIVFQIIEFRFLLAVHDLFRREYGLCLRIPVDHPQAAVDQAFVIEIHKDLFHGFTADGIHREGGAVPVAAGTQAAQLLEDDAAVLLGPCPCMLEELLAGQVTFPDALLRQAVHHLGLGGDGGVVGSRHPERILSQHPRPAYKHVLQGVVHHMPHVEHARDIGRRNHDHIGFAPVRFRVEVFVFEPVFVPLTLHAGGIVFVR